MIVPTSPEEIEFTSSLEIDARVNENVDYWLNIINKSLRKVYDAFIFNNQTLSSLLAMNGMFTAFTVPYLLLIIFNRPYCATLYENTNWFFYVAFLIGIHFIVWRFYLQEKEIVRKHRGSLPEQERLRIVQFQQKVFFAFHTLGCYRLLSKVVNGRCENVQNWGANWNCNQLADAYAIPSEPAVVIMMIPLIYSSMMRGAHFHFTFMLWIMTMISLVFSSIYIAAINSMIFIIFYVVGSSVTLVQTRRLSFYLFFTHRKLQESLQESMKASDEAWAAEIRQTIAGVSHDQLMPLNIFRAVLDHLNHQVQQIVAKQKNDALSLPDVDEFIENISHCVTNMRNTNSFMLMTINRCVDYTKALKGVNLIPKYETINLMETLSLPLDCIREIQKRVPIVLEVVSKEICSHIITDKQWLQENVLFLLSNAVKYSSDGEVVVRVKKDCLSTMPFSMSNYDVDLNHSQCEEKIDESIYPTHSEASLPHPQGNSHCKSTEHVTAGDLSQRTYTSTEYLRIEVEDRGASFSDLERASMFSPFKQAERLAGGTGLGLFSLAKRIEALEGKCGVEKRRDGAEGSLFWFMIPYRPHFPKQEVIAKPITPPSPSVTYTTNPVQITAHFLLPSGETVSRMLNREAPVLNILVVDDSRAIVKMTSMMLRRHNHHVSTAMNGAEAVKLVNDRLEREGRGFDVILMDLQMPVMDGFEATRRLREMEKSRTFPISMDDDGPLIGGTNCCEEVVALIPNIIIGVATLSDVNTAQEAYKYGMDALLPKPFALETFYRIYHYVLSKRSQGEIGGNRITDGFA